LPPAPCAESLLLVNDGVAHHVERTQVRITAARADADAAYKAAEARERAALEAARGAEARRMRASGGPRSS
jgi:hypothetical protein